MEKCFSKNISMYQISISISISMYIKCAMVCDDNRLSLEIISDSTTSKTISDLKESTKNDLRSTSKMSLPVKAQGPFTPSESENSL